MSSVEVKLGPNYELVLPETLCREAGFEPGQPVYIFVRNKCASHRSAPATGVAGTCLGARMEVRLPGPQRPLLISLNPDPWLLTPAFD